MQKTTEDYSEVPLGLGLELVDGRGFLSARNERVGPVDVKLLELEIPQLEFPFDTSGGPGAFKSRRCTLRHLALGLPSERVIEMFSSARLRTKGFSNIRVGFKEGTLELGGTFSRGEQEVDFTTRASLVPGEGLQLNVIFFDLRVYGALSVPAPLIPVYLCEALGLPYITASRCAAWELQPAGEFLRSVLPRMGWKIPDYRDASIVNVGVNRDQIVLVCGDAEAEGETGEGAGFTSSGLEAIYAAEAMVFFRNAEQALAAGEIGAAYDGYKGAAGSEQLGAWAVARLLQIGVCESRFYAETCELARDYSGENPGDAQGYLALAAIALAENRFQDAAELYVKIADDPALDNNRFDTNAAELAAARAFERRDIDRAISHYEKAASRDRTSVSAYAGIFRLRCAREDWEGAKPAGERLVRLDLPDEVRAQYWCELGDIYLSRLESVKMARRAFEQALRGVADCEAALEGLAQTYITQGEPARAVGYLTRLFEKVRLDRRVDRMAALGLQLGGLWENELGDLKAAIEHYQFVIGLNRRERTARMRLARLYVGQERWQQARLLYDDLIAIMQEDDRSECRADFVEANLGLAHLLRTTGAQGWEVLECLERVLERSPEHREALERAVPLLRAEGKWQQLVVRLRGLSALSSAAEVRVGLLSECAEVCAEKLCAMDESRACLEEILDIQPDNGFALQGLREAVESAEELVGFGLRLEKAAMEVADLEEKGDLWLELARLRARQEAPVYETLEAYGRALEYNPYRVDGARELVELVAPLGSPEGHVEALLLLADATSDKPERVGALLERSRILWRTLKSSHTVEESLREVLQTTPRCLEAWLLLGELLEETGRVAESVTALECCLGSLEAEDSVRVQIFEHLARLARKIQDHPAEASYLATLVEARGREEWTCRRLIEVLHELDRKRDAAEHLEAWARAGDVGEPAALTLEAIELWGSLGESGRVIDLCDGLIQDRFARGVVEQVAASTPSPAQQAAVWLEKTYREKDATESVVQAIQYQLLLGPEDYPGTLRSLALAQIAIEDFLSAETTCRTLLEHAPGSRLAHGFIASRHDVRESYLVALIHWMSYLNSDDDDDTLDVSALNPRERALSLAREVAPGSLAVIRILENVDGDSEEGLLLKSVVAPLGEQLVEKERWDAFLRLREWQFEQKIPGDWITWKWEVATVLHRKLSRYDDGIAVYREICGLTTPGNNHSSTAQQCIIEIYEHGERWEELSRFLMELSEVEACQEEALRLGLDAADVLMQQGGDPGAARRLYRGFNLRFGRGDCISPLLSALREYGLYEDIAQLLEINLEYSWVTDDGRFLELVDLLAGRLGRPEQAVHLAEKATRYMPQVDLGWRTLVELLEEHEGMGSPNGVLYRWGESEGVRKRWLMNDNLLAAKINRDPGQLPFSHINHFGQLYSLLVFASDGAE